MDGSFEQIKSKRTLENLFLILYLSPAQNKLMVSKMTGQKISRAQAHCNKPFTWNKTVPFISQKEHEPVSVKKKFSSYQNVSNLEHHDTRTVLEETENFTRNNKISSDKYSL